MLESDSFFRQQYDALKRALLTNLKFVEFYKDLQAYVSQRYLLPDCTDLLLPIQKLMHDTHKLDEVRVSTDDLSLLESTVMPQ
jgi:hypothetical protein